MVFSISLGLILEQDVGLYTSLRTPPFIRFPYLDHPHVGGDNLILLVLNGERKDLYNIIVTPNAFRGNHSFFTRPQLVYCRPGVFCNLLARLDCSETFTS